MQLFDDELAIATDDGAQVISTKTLSQKNLSIPSSDQLRYWSNACRYVQKDESGNYGVSTKTGFYIFSPSGKLKNRYDFYTEKDIGQNWMLFGNRTFRLPDGNILQRNSEGLLTYDRNSDQFNDLRKTYPKAASLINAVVKRQDHFYFISRYEVIVINKQTNQFEIIDMKNGNVRSFPTCIPFAQEVGWQTTISRIDDNTFAMNSRINGFYLLKIDTATQTLSCDPKKYFTEKTCTVIFRDKQKRLWIGTNTGLFMEIKHPRIITVFPLDVHYPGADLWLSSVFVTHNEIFAGTNHKEVYVVDKTTKQILHKFSFAYHANLSNYVTSLVQVDRDTILAGTNSGLYWINTSNFSSGELSISNSKTFDKNFTNLFVDSKDNVWMPLSYSNLVACLNWKTKLISCVSDTTNPSFKVNIVNTIAEDWEKNIWFGGDAIARWNMKTRKIDTLIERLPTQRNRKKGFAVISDGNGDVWTMVKDDGFARITGQPIHVRPENILSQNYGSSLPSMIFNKMFIPTMHGIGYLDMQTRKGIMFQAADGLPQKPVTSLLFPDSTDNSIWFGSGKDLCMISSVRSNYFLDPPDLKINELEVINDTIFHYPEDKITLSHDQNDLRLSISAVNFTDPENMRFAYRIKDRDSSWIDAGNQPNILLTNIAPGNYKLEIKVYAYDDKWPEQVRSIGIQINPPFTKTVLFYVLVTSLITALIYLLYRMRIRQIKQKANLDKLLAETEMKALHAQMNPHFIFNCLNSIREMILNKENQQASHYLSKFAQLIRTTLNQSSRPLVSLHNTIEYLKQYLEMEKIRSDNFVYHFHIDEELKAESIMLPPMLIQPFIENAIWHGADPKAEPMQLNIHFVRQGEQLLCIVEDNGVGIEASLKNKIDNQSSHRSVGIDNVRQRIHLLNEKYDLESSLTIQDKGVLPNEKGTGTIVTLYLPIKNPVL
jgi:ligand-binding sensor domain-containing protein